MDYGHQHQVGNGWLVDWNSTLVPELTIGSTRLHVSPLGVNAVRGLEIKFPGMWTKVAKQHVVSHQDYVVCSYLQCDKVFCTEKAS